MHKFVLLWTATFALLAFGSSTALAAPANDEAFCGATLDPWSVRCNGVTFDDPLGGHWETQPFCLGEDGACPPP